MREALGFIETGGLIAAIEAADSMVKSANVRILQKQYVGKGLVSIIVAGDVGAVKAAVDAGVSAVRDIGGVLHSVNVIPSPVDELSIFLEEETDDKVAGYEEKVEIYPNIEDESFITEDNSELIEDINIKIEIDINEEREEVRILEINSKKDIDEFIKENKKDSCSEELMKLTNKKLRIIALEYESDDEIRTKINRYNKKDLVDFIINKY